MTKLEFFAKETGLKLVEKTTVWNIHQADHLSNLAKKKGTNLNKTFSDMKKRGLKGGFTLVVGRIGRSQHSATEIGIFEGVTNVFDEDEIFINDVNSVYF